MPYCIGLRLAFSIRKRASQRCDGEHAGSDQCVLEHDCAVATSEPGTGFSSGLRLPKFGM